MQRQEYYPPTIRRRRISGIDNTYPKLMLSTGAKHPKTHRPWIRVGHTPYQVVNSTLQLFRYAGQKKTSDLHIEKQSCRIALDAAHRLLCTRATTSDFSLAALDPRF